MIKDETQNPDLRLNVLNKLASPEARSVREKRRTEISAELQAVEKELQNPASADENVKLLIKHITLLKELAVLKTDDEAAAEAASLAASESN